MDERRVQKRFEVCLQAVWEGATGNYDARVTDISDEGCYIDVMCESRIGDVIRFNVCLPNGEWIELTGQVAHHHPQIGFGVRFLDLMPDLNEKITGLLEHLSMANTKP